MRNATIAAIALVMLVLVGCTMPGEPPREEYLKRLDTYIAATAEMDAHGKNADFSSAEWRNSEVKILKRVRSSIRALLELPPPSNAGNATKAWPQMVEALKEGDFVVGVMLTATEANNPALMLPYQDRFANAAMLMAEATRAMNGE